MRCADGELVGESNNPVSKQGTCRNGSLRDSRKNLCCCRKNLCFLTDHAATLEQRGLTTKYSWLCASRLAQSQPIDRRCTEF